jgi:hypothetical protein
MITKAKLMQRLERLEQTIQVRRDAMGDGVSQLALEELSDEDLRILREYADRGTPLEYTAEEMSAAERYGIAEEAAKRKIAHQRSLYFLNGGFAPSDVIAADGKAVLEADEAETDLAGFVMRAISRFFATEQVFADHDLEDTRKGAGFLAVRRSTDELRNTAWSII